jgi:hypothetical protein
MQFLPAMQTALEKASVSTQALFQTLEREAELLGIQFHPQKDRLMARHPIGRANFFSLTFTVEAGLTAFIRVDAMPVEVFDNNSGTKEFGVTFKHIDAGAKPLYAVYRVPDEDTLRHVLAIAHKVTQQKPKWHENEPQPDEPEERQPRFSGPRQQQQRSSQRSRHPQRDDNFGNTRY